MTLSGPVRRTDGGTNVYVYFINSWTYILIYHRRNSISSLQPVKRRPRTTKSCRDYQGGTSTPRCGGPPLSKPFQSGIHYPHLQLRPTLLTPSSVGWPQNHSAHPTPNIGVLPRTRRAVWQGLPHLPINDQNQNQNNPPLSLLYGGVEGPPHIFFDIMLSHTDDIVTRP